MKKILSKSGLWLGVFCVFLLVSSNVFGQWTIPAIAGALPNSTTQINSDCFELTSGTNQRGVVWNNTQMDLSQPFDITLLVWHDVHGADAIAFVLQNTGLNAHGAGGNGNGYANAVPASTYPGINPSVAVELDLFFNNVAGINDIPADHVAIHVNGDLSAAASGPAAAIPNGNPIPDNTCFPLRIVWAPAPTNQMEVYWNNQLRLTWNQNIVQTIFGNNPNVFWGLTGSCGSVAMTQRVCVGANFAQAGQDRTICLGDTAHLSATGGGTYLWGFGAPLISDPNIANPVFTSTFTQTVTLPLTVTNPIGCIDRDTIILTVVDTPAIQLVLPASICAGESAVIQANVTGGTGNYSYLWNTGATTDTLLANPLVTTTYSLTVTDLNGCSSSEAATLVVNPQESISILNNDTSLCLGAGLSNINVTGSLGIDSYSWTPTAGVTAPNTATPSLQPTVSTTYYLTGTNSNTGCSGVDSILVEVFDLQVNDFPDTIVCLGDTVRLVISPSVGSGDYSIFWIQTGVDTLSSDTVFDPYVVAAGGGVYFATITDNISGCTRTVSTIVTVRSLQVQASPSSILINPGQRVQMEAFGAMFYTWEPDTMLSCANCPAPVSMPSSSITYTVTGTDTTGCIGIATVIIVTDSLMIPNVFSPNGDGINDELLLNYHGTAYYEILVFDRWGVKIFQTKDNRVMWNGRTSNGTDAPEGVYYLAVRILGDDAIPEKDKQKVFAVTLMR